MHVLVFYPLCWQIFRKIFSQYFVETLISFGTDFIKNVVPGSKQKGQRGCWQECENVEE